MQKFYPYHFFLFLIGTLVIGPVTLSAEELPVVPEGPLLLTSVKPEQLNVNYWIDRLPNPDKPLKSPIELKLLNQQIHEMVPDRVNVFEMGESVPGRPYREQIEREFKAVRARPLFDIHDKKIERSYFNETVKPRLALEKINKKVNIRWAVAIRETSVRSLPTTKKMLEEIGDIEFDQLQFTLIKTWTPVAILHQSKGGSWFYVQAPYTRGWLQAKDVAVFPKKTQLQNYVESKYFLVVTGESVGVFWDTAFFDFGERLSMGTVIPYQNYTEQGYEVIMPRRLENGRVFFKTGYIQPNADVSLDYLPYTQRNVLNQAFKLLGARYGWGGTYYGRDCSGFTHDVFLSLGVDLPRNSTDQIFAGTQLSHFESFEDREKKIEFLKIATPGITLLRMPLHMMLYLGEDQGQHYVIHATWAERVGYESVLDEKKRINQVVISDLSLNGNSYLGPLFDRIVSMSEVA